MKNLFSTFLLCIGFALSPLVANAASCDLSSYSTDTPPSATTDKTYDRVDHCVKKIGSHLQGATARFLSHIAMPPVVVNRDTFCRISLLRTQA